MKLIVFEGLDGAGKSTLMTQLSEGLGRQQIECIKTREPGGSPLGDQIRDMLLKKGEHAPKPWAELFLYEAARAQHVECLIRPALAEKKWVLCDRFSASSVAFQCGGRGLSQDLVQSLNHMATQGLQPDLYVLLDLPTEVAFARMQGRELDRFESEKRDFHERVRRSYLDQARQEAHRWLILDAQRSAADLFQDVWAELLSRKWILK